MKALAGWSLDAQHPWLLAALLVLAALVAVRVATADVTLSRPRKWLAGGFALLAVVLAALAAGEVALIRPSDRMNVVVAADRSRSIDQVPSAEPMLRDALIAAEASMRKDDQLGVVRFASAAAVSEPMHRKGEGAAHGEPAIARDVTDIGAGIRRAVDEVLAAGGGRVILVSDGVQNRGDALAAAARARALGVPIDVVPLEQKIVPDLHVVGARGPTLADEGETIELRTVVHAPKPRRGDRVDVEVTIKRDGAVRTTFTTQISSGEDVIRWRDRNDDAGLHRYDVHVRAIDASLDGSVEDNDATSFVRVRGPSTVLVLQREEAKAAPLKRALEAEGFRVVVRGRFGVPSDLAELAAFDLVVLADIPAKDLVPPQMEAMATYVKELGGGLLLLGSDGSMGPGGYGQTPIEEISPVAFDLTKERRRTSLTELIVIDFSGSMGVMVDGKHNKLDLANEAAARAAALLGSGDRLGVWHVDTRIFETVKIGPVGDPKATGDAIRKVGVGGGGIYIDLSLENGYAALGKETQNLRHLLLFSDGADAEQRDRAPNLVAEAAKKGITTSVVSLGDGPDAAALAQMAKIGGGRFYLITDARKLPAVFAQETILAARSSVREEDFVPALRAGAPTLRGLSTTGFPALHGYVVTQAKPRAELAMTALEGDPLLATWPQGLGHVGAWTSDFDDVWASDFIHAPVAAQLFAQLARAVARKSDDARVSLHAEASEGTLHVVAEPSGTGETNGLLHLRAHVAGPDGVGREVELLPAAGGRYALDLPVDAPGAYVVRGIDVGADGHGQAPAGLAAAVLTRADELRPTGSDLGLLARIAELSGGEKQASIATVFARRVGVRPTALPLAPYLLPAALVAMLLGVASRRLGWPSMLTRRAAPLGEVAVEGASAPAPLAVVPPRAKSPMKRADSSLSSPRAPVEEPHDAATRAAPVGNAASAAAAIASKRKEQTARAPAAPVIASVKKPSAPAAASPAGGAAKGKDGAESLAELARKRREKKG